MSPRGACNHTDKCNSFDNCGRACGTNQGNGSFTRGNNYRMTQQFDKLVKETAIRRANADYRSAMLDIIEAIRKVQAHSAALAKAGR